MTTLQTIFAALAVPSALYLLAFATGGLASERFPLESSRPATNPPPTPTNATITIHLTTGGTLIAAQRGTNWTELSRNERPTFVDGIQAGIVVTRRNPEVQDVNALANMAALWWQATQGGRR